MHVYSTNLTYFHIDFLKFCVIKQSWHVQIHEFSTKINYFTLGESYAGWASLTASRVWGGNQETKGQNCVYASRERERTGGSKDHIITKASIWLPYEIQVRSRVVTDLTSVHDIKW